MGDITLRTDNDQALAFALKTHRVVLASASIFFGSLFHGCCACEQITVILPGVSNSILSCFITWLYTGVVRLNKYDELSEWNKLLGMFGIENSPSNVNDKVDGDGGINEETIHKSIDSNDGVSNKVIYGDSLCTGVESRQTENESLLSNSFNTLYSNGSPNTSRKLVCDVERFSSEEDGSADAYVDSVPEFSKPRKANVSSCIQCDLSDDESEEAMSKKNITNDPKINFVGNEQCEENESDSSSPEFLDASMSVEIEPNTSQYKNKNNRSLLKVNCQNETVYQDCNEEIEESYSEIESLKIINSTDKINISVKYDSPLNIEQLDANLNLSESNKKTADQVLDGSYSLDESANSSVNESYEEEENYDESYEEKESDEYDPSWDESCSDVSEDERKVSKKVRNISVPLGDITNKISSNVDSPASEVLVSDSGPVQIPPRCLCKGSCVRNCCCRSAGVICSSMCSCKPSKCKLRADLTPNILLKSPVDKQIYQTGVTNSFISPLSAVASGAAVDQSQVTPSNLPASVFEITSVPSTIAKKRKKKLFTETVGPQEI